MVAFSSIIHTSKTVFQRFKKEIVLEVVEKAKCSFTENFYLIKMKIVKDWAIRMRGDTI